MAIPGLEKYQKKSDSSLTNLLRLYNAFEDKKEDSNDVYKQAMNDIGGDILSSFDDVTYESNLNNLEEYYNRNIDKLDSDSIELYTYLKEKSKTHREKYTTFDGAFLILDNSGRGLIDKFTEYNEADILDKEGLKNDIVNSQLDYIKNKETMVKRYGDFFQHPSGKFLTESNRISTYDNMFHFGLESISEDDNTPYFVDPQEFRTLSQSITEGTTAPYDRFINTEVEHKRTAGQYNQKIGMDMIQEVNFKGEFLDKQALMSTLDGQANDINLPDNVRIEAQSEYDNLYNQQAIYLDKDVYTNLPQAHLDKPLTYGELIGPEGLEIQEIFDNDINLISKQLPSIIQGYSNSMDGQNLFDLMPSTYSKWENKDWSAQPTRTLTPGEIYKADAKAIEDKLRTDWEVYQKASGDNITFEEFKKATLPSEPELPKLEVSEQSKIDQYKKDVSNYNEATSWLKNNPQHLDKHWEKDKPKLRKKYWAIKKQFQNEYKKSRKIKTELGEFKKTGFEEIYDLIEKYDILDLPKIQD